MTPFKMICDRCNEFEKSYNSLASAQMIAWSNGWRYEGEIFKYCPWCGFNLTRKEEIT